MFRVNMPVNIEHINYGNHLGHDSLITLMHEARLRFFDKLGQSELNFYGISLIVKSLHVNYRQEAFRGDVLSLQIRIAEMRGSAFSLQYNIRNQQGENVADAQIVLVGFDYSNRKIARLPDLCREALMQLPPINSPKKA